ncbi:MAG: hypothetical protein JST92_23455 [Deltaproteobacteria bacterium]|nr:hypothetical protein [Deltaproteobacteria bacterium]
MLWFLAALLAAPTPAPVHHKTKLAVMDVRLSAELEPAYGPFLTQVLAGEVADRRGLAPLVSADIRALLGFEKTRQNLGCDENSESCMAELAGALGVDEVVHASVAVAGAQYLITVTRLDAHKALPLGRFADSTPRDQAALVHAMRVAAWKLFGGAEPAPLPPPPIAEPARAPSTSTAAAAQPAPEAAPAAATEAPRDTSNTRRTWAIVAAAGAVGLAGTGAGFGLVALHAANQNDSATARPRAHAADLFFAGAALTGAAAVWLWLGGADASASSSTQAAIAPASHGAALVVARSF